MNQQDVILVTGGTGLVGTAIVRTLLKRGFRNIVATYHNRNPEGCFSTSELFDDSLKFIKIDLVDQRAVASLFSDVQPDFVFLAAAKVGGIMANHTHRAQFIYENLQIQNNIIHHSYLGNVKKLLFLGSTCIYPSNAPQPLKESYLMTDLLEYTSEPYGIAKIAGVKTCESYNLQYKTNYISVMPTNLYGPNDNYNLNNSHFLPAFFRKMYLAKCLMENNWKAIRDDLHRNPVENINGHASQEEVLQVLQKHGITEDSQDIVTLTLWGTGSPRREVMHSDDMADACLYVMEHVDFEDLIRFEKSSAVPGVVGQEIRNTHINIGLGYDFTIREIAMKVKGIVGFQGNVAWNSDMPDGTLQKLTDVSKLKHLGWESKISFDDGLNHAYDSYRNAAMPASL